MPYSDEPEMPEEFPQPEEPVEESPILPDPVEEVKEAKPKAKKKKKKVLPKKLKVVVYCQVGRDLDMAKYSIGRAVEYSGLSPEEYKLVFITWKTSDDVYAWLKENDYEYHEMEDIHESFLTNLYRGWNLGYEIGFKDADYVCPIATDHSFYEGWLSNLMKHASPNRIVNCRLVEPGNVRTLHLSKNFGMPGRPDFKESEWLSYAADLAGSGNDELAVDEWKYGHRFDAMPFVCAKDVWEKFGPMDEHSVSPTGDTDFFNRCKKGGVEIVKSLDSLSYHWGAGEHR